MTILIVGGTSGLGLELARHYAQQGRSVVVTGRDPEKAKSVAADLGNGATGLAFDLSKPSEIAPGLADVDAVTHLVVTAVDRLSNPVEDFDAEAATRLATLKLVGYSEVIHALLPRIDRENGSVLLFGGHNKDKPHTGSMIMTSLNTAVMGMVKALALELAPLRVNSIHPAIVGDSARWIDKPVQVEAIRATTPTGRYVTTADVVHGCAFLLENPAANGINLTLDGGRTLT